MTGSTAQFLIYPGDVVKTHFIIADKKTMKSRPNVFEVAKHVFRTEGIAGFYKGAALSLIGCAPFIAIRMSTYDSLMSNFQN